MMKKDYGCQSGIKITVKEKGKIHQINIGNISYIKCDSYVSSIYFINCHNTISLAKLLKYFEIELSEFGFIRINRNYLVNAKYIDSIECENRKLILVSGENINISIRQMLKMKETMFK